MPKRKQGRYNTSDPKIITKAQALVVLLDHYPEPRPSCPYRPPESAYLSRYFEFFLGEYQAFTEKEDPKDLKTITAMRRARRYLKTLLSTVVVYADHIQRCENYLVRWPGFDTSRNPGGVPEGARRKPLPRRPVPVGGYYGGFNRF